MTDLAHSPGQEAGAPEGAENKTPQAGEAPAWLKQNVDGNDTESKDPAVNAGSSALNGGGDTVVTDPPKVGEAGDTATDSADENTDDDIDHRGDYVPRHETKGNRRGLFTAIGAGATALLIGAGALLFGARGGEGTEKVVPPDPTEIGLPGQPDSTQPENEAEPTTPGLSEDPYKSPFGQVMEYNARPKSLGDIKVYESPEVYAANEAATDLNIWLSEGPEVNADALIAGKDGAVFRGFAAVPVDIKIEETGEIVKTWAFDVLPTYNTQKTPEGRIRHAYTSLLDEDSVIGTGSEGDSEDPTKFDRIAFGKTDLIVYPATGDGDVTMTVKLDKSKKPADLENQRGEGGFVATLSGNDKPAPGQESPEMVIGRRVVVIGDLTPEQVVETGKQLLRNAGYPLEAA